MIDVNCTYGAFLAPDLCFGFYFRRIAHETCSTVSNQKKVKIPIFFHNLRGFDAHLIMHAVDPKRHGKITCIPRTTEQYISFTIGDIVFKDSLAFTNKSLDKLVETLTAEELVNTRTHIERPFTISDSTTTTTSRKWKAKVACKPEKRLCCTHTNDELGDEDNELCCSTIDELPASDYRHHPVKKPTLTQEQLRIGEERFKLIQPRGVVSI